MSFILAMQKWIVISKYLFNFCELKVYFFDSSSQDIFIAVGRNYGAHITTPSLIQPRVTTS